VFGGKKAQLEQRLAIVRVSSSNIYLFRSELQAFLGASDSSPPKVRPLINDFYHRSFNFVDRFDLTSSRTQYYPRICHEFYRVFISLVHLAATATYHICRDNFRKDPTYPRCPLSCRRFTRFLADALIASFAHLKAQD